MILFLACEAFWRCQGGGGGGGSTQAPASPVSLANAAFFSALERNLEEEEEGNGGGEMGEQRSSSERGGCGVTAAHRDRRGQRVCDIIDLVKLDKAASKRFPRTALGAGWGLTALGLLLPPSMRPRHLGWS